MIEFTLPSLGSDMEEGKLLQWKIAPGDSVKRGQVVAVVDTSKAAVDVESWQEGTVCDLLVEPGQTVPVGTVLATFLDAGETPATARRQPGAVGQPAPGEPAPAHPAPARPAVAEQAPTPPGAAQRTAAHPAAARAATQPGAAQPGAAQPAATQPPATQPAAATMPVSVPAPSPARASHAEPAAPALAGEPGEIGRRRISPAARRRAEEAGIDLDTIAGTGPDGAITLQDIEHASGAAAAAAPADKRAEMRRAIGAAMSRSKREIPHYYLSESVPMRRALDWLAAANAQRGIAERLLPAVVQIKAVASTLKEYPDLNGVFAGGGFRPSKAAHVGVAISLRQGGLIAPAIHDAGDKTLDQLMRDLTDLVARARAGSLRSSEMSDPTITITNLGDQGVDAVYGVIYPPQVALVGFGRIAARPWVDEGALVSMPVVTASLAADHRVSDGHYGGLFLAALRERLQHPDQL